jgi:nitroreductase
MEDLTIDGLLDLARKRRSIRAFLTQDVPDESVHKILEISRWSPSSGNNQQWEFIIIRDKGTRKKIAEFYKEQLITKIRMEETREKELRFPLHGPSFKDAPVFILVLGDPRLLRACPLKTQKERGARNYYSSLASAVLLIHLAASALGLGSQYVSDANSPFMEAMIKDLLGIPEPLEVYELIPIGYPKKVPPAPFRRELDEIIHQERYEAQKFRNDERIMNFIKSKNVPAGQKA